MEEHQALHIWTHCDEEIEYSEYSLRFREFFPDADPVACFSILQSAKLVRSHMGRYSITKKGWKARCQISAPLPSNTGAGCTDNPNNGETTPHNPGADRPADPNRIRTKIFERKATENPSQPDTDSESPWKLFRKLLGYYLDCVRCDERPSNLLSTEGIGSAFIPIMTHGQWWPSSIEQDVRLQIPIRDGQNAFLKRVLLGKDDYFLGYPFHLLGAEGNRFIAPVFCVPVSRIRHTNNELSVTLDFTNADVNASWLDKRFRTNHEKTTFLQQCGLVEQYDDEEGFYEELNGSDLPEALQLDIPSSIDALRIFFRDILQSPLSPMATDPVTSFDGLENGIHNAALLFAGKQLRYSVSLITELQKIRRTSDQELSKSALRHFFASPNLQQFSPSAAATPTLVDIPVIPFTPLNYEQEEAVELALTNDMTVITGPPGTGKSQVVVNLLANLAVRGKTALFASKNHKAIDAVVPRTNSLVDHGNLITRMKNIDTGDVFTWKKAVNEVLAATALPYDESVQKTLTNVAAKIQGRDLLLDDAESWSRAERRLSELNGMLEKATSGISDLQSQAALDGKALPNKQALQFLQREVEAIPHPPAGRLFRIRLVIWRLARRARLVKALESVSDTMDFYEVLADPRATVPASKDSLRDVCETLDKISEIHDMGTQIAAAERVAKSTRPLESSLSEISLLINNAIDLSGELVNKAVKNRFSLMSDTDLREMQQMKGILNSMNAAGVGDPARIRWERFFDRSFEKLLGFFPMWAVSNLSVRSGLPLVAGVMDTVIVDEASQCDIVSTIPLLFRAKTAVVVGDPQQLTPVHKMTKGVNVQLLRRHGLLEEENVFSYSYLDASYFQLAASHPNCTGKVQLKDHYRCHPDIAMYFNDQFYGKTLRVLTNPRELNVPRNYRAGLMWTDVVGATEKVSGSGAICRAEIDAIVDELDALLCTRDFQGTVGVVTPFRIQADRIRDAAYSRIPDKKLESAEFVCATADGFQGDERDVILMSLMYQPDLYRGGEWYLTAAETRNVWNVAVSRARAALHVFGNSEHCQKSESKHLSALAMRCNTPPDEAAHQGQFESVWERRLYDALLDAGVTTVSQYPLAGKRLDLAVPSVRLDIEVDGEKYHKDYSGLRKAEDLWRDLTVQAAGWTPLRFWVYELREDMAACVSAIQKKIQDLQDRSE